MTTKRMVMTIVAAVAVCAHGAGCAFVYPNRVNGKAAKFLDPLANDQDWVMLYFLRNSL